MSILRILQYPDPGLKKRAQPVTEISDEIQKIINDMLATLHNTENCAGLAATQLAIKNPPRITVMYDYRKGDKPSKEEALCLINPEIISKEGESAEPEGCMSVSGGIYEPVVRAKKVRVRALDREGNFFEIEGEDFMAKLLQHEIDHLNGLIFIDRISKLKRMRIDKKMSKLQKRAKE
jgi:peptide deformylase